MRLDILMGGNPFGSSLWTTPLDSSSYGSIFSETLAGGVTSPLTNKATPCFVSFDFMKNSPPLHMDTNLDSFSFVDFGVGEIGLMETLLPFQLNI